MTDAVEYVANGLAWGVGGFIVGWLLGSIRRDLTRVRHDVEEATMSDRKQHDDEHDDEHAADPQRSDVHHDTTRTATRWLGIVVALLAVATVVQTYAVTRRINEINECRVEYNAAFAEASQERAKLANDDRHALNTMILTIARNTGKPAKQRAALDAWAKRTEATEAERRTHPLPELPADRCET